jgi:hypothetical protein
MRETELQELIYEGDENQVIDFLSKINVNELSQDHDYLTYPIKRKLNGIVRALLHIGNINVRVNNSVALSVAKASNNGEAQDIIREVLADPLCTLRVNFWDSNNIKTGKVYKHSRTSTLLRQIDNIVEYPYKIMVDGLIIDDPQDMLYQLLGSGEPFSPLRRGIMSPRWSPRYSPPVSPLGRFNGDLSHTNNDAPIKNIKICISIGGETYPSESVTILANMVEWLSPDQLEKIWHDDDVIKDGTIVRIIELGRVLPSYMRASKDDIDQLYIQGKLHMIINAMSMCQLVNTSKRCIVDNNCKNLRLVYLSKNWDYANIKFNPYVLCIEHASIDCLKITIDHSGVYPGMDDNAALKRSESLGDEASSELLKSILFFETPSEDSSVIVKHDKPYLLDLTFSDMSVSTKK